MSDLFRIYKGNERVKTSTSPINTDGLLADTLYPEGYFTITRMGDNQSESEHAIVPEFRTLPEAVDPEPPIDENFFYDLDSASIYAYGGTMERNGDVFTVTRTADTPADESINIIGAFTFPTGTFRQGQEFILTAKIKMIEITSAPSSAGSLGVSILASGQPDVRVEEYSENYSTVNLNEEYTFTAELFMPEGAENITYVSVNGFLGDTNFIGKVQFYGLTLEEID